MTFDENLMRALSEDHEERMIRRAAEEKDHKFSLSYRLWERKFLKDLRQGRCESSWTLKKARKYVTAAVITCSVFVLTGCMVIGTTIGRYSFNDKKTYSELFLEKHPSDKTQIEEYYGLPEEDGWEIDEFYADDNGLNIRYICGDKIALFSQEVILKNMGHINTENAIIEPISLYEDNDGFFIALKSGNDSVLYWVYNGYLFNTSGNLDKNELLNLAYSTKIVDF